MSSACNISDEGTWRLHAQSLMMLVVALLRRTAAAAAVTGRLIACGAHHLSTTTGARSNSWLPPVARTFAHRSTSHAVVMTSRSTGATAAADWHPVDVRDVERSPPRRERQLRRPPRPASITSTLMMTMMLLVVLIVCDSGQQLLRGVMRYTVFNAQ